MVKQTKKLLKPLASRARDIHCKYSRCEQHDEIKFNENELSRGPPSGPQVGKHIVTSGV
jgi:hypothetical protein